MLNEKMLFLGKNRSEIRELFEYGNTLKKRGERVFDFTLGNPSVKTPKWVTNALIEGLNEENIHAYTSAQGSLKARQTVKNLLNKSKKTQFSSEGIILTCGAAASLCGVFKALTSSCKDEIIVLSPYFPEYKVFIEGAGAIFKAVGFTGDNFEPDYGELESAITKNTKAVVINNPNNPSGKLFTCQEIERLVDVLKKKQKELSTTVYLVSDEPYREIVFGNEALPFIPDFYEDTIVCYSYSKSLSLPGERIGYIAIPDKITAFNDLYAGFLGSLRSYGYVCAPSLFQYMIENFKEEYSDFSIYERNKAALLSGLTKLGFKCNNPRGAFYLMVKAPDGDGKKMSELAKRQGILIVPTDTFGASGWVRIATCVSEQTVSGSMPYFERLAKDYNL